MAGRTKPDATSDDSFNLNEKDILGQMGEDDEDDLPEDDTEEEEGEEGEEESSEADEEEGSETQEGQEAEAQRAPEVRVKADKKGNLIDPKSGKIIATAGPARRFYEDLTNTKQRLFGVLQQNQQFRQNMGQAATALTALQSKVETLEKQKGIPEALGLSPAEATEFLSVAAKFKNDSTAVDAIKYMLTKAVQRGINLESLGKGAGSTVDLNVFAKDITDKVEQLVKPLSDRFNQSEEQSKQEGYVKQEIAQLLQEHPDAQPHLPVLGAMLRQPEFRHVKSLNEAWLHLKNYLLRQQLQQRGQPNPSPNGLQSRPSGRRAPGTRVSNEIDDSPMSVDTEYRDIVRAVVEEYGGIDK